MQPNAAGQRRLRRLSLSDMNDTAETNAQGCPTAAGRLSAGMVGMGMIFEETYRPMFETARREGLYDRRFGLCEIDHSI